MNSTQNAKWSEDKKLYQINNYLAKGIRFLQAEVSWNAKKVCCQILHLENSCHIFCAVLTTEVFMLLRFPWRAASWCEDQGAAPKTWWTLKRRKSGFGCGLSAVSRRDTAYVFIVKILLLQSFLSSKVCRTWCCWATDFHSSADYRLWGIWGDFNEKKWNWKSIYRKTTCCVQGLHGKEDVQ